MPARTLAFGDFELDELRFELRRGGQPIELQATPFRLLQHLVRERERVVTRDELLEAVWPDVTVSDTALSSALKEVRRALGDDGRQQRWIQTLRGRGVRFVGAVEALAPTPAERGSWGQARRPEACVTTILFADLATSTAPVESLGDEGAQPFFDALHVRVRKVLEAHAGEELQWLGDGIMAAFDSAAGAVRAAIALQRLAREGATRERLVLRVGLSAGELLHKDAGSGYFGLPMIVASRLSDCAAPGEILASGVVAGLLAGRRAFRFRELGAVELEGVQAPVPACAVEYQADPGAAALAARIPFVGREAELARLEAALERAEAGQGSVLFVTGEPGIGKTRLVHEFAARTVEGGARVLAGSCFEGEGSRPYAPFAEALDAYAGEADRSELLADLGPYGSEIGVLAPRLRACFPELPELPRLGGDEERTRLFYALSELLLATAKRAPLVLVLDDLHWADGATIALLRYVARLAKQGRLLLLGCYREGEVGRDHPLTLALATMTREVGYERIALAGLDSVSVGELLAALAEHEVNRGFSEHMATRTGGNPFFLRELLAHLVESGRLHREEGIWTASVPLEEFGIPEGVRQVIGRRLGLLSQAANRLLAAAAAFLGVFSFEVARRAVDLAEAEALDALDEALDARLVRPVSGAGDRYEFAHDLIRHTLYALPSPSRRARVHRRLAEEMERAFGEPVGERSAEIARQYHASRELPGAERGAAHALAAADRAERAAAQEEVARFLRLALDLLPEGDGGRTRLLAHLALALAWSFEGAEAARVGSAAADRIAATEGDAAAAAYLCELSRILTPYACPLAWRLAEQGLRFAGERRDLVWCRLAVSDQRRREAEDPTNPGQALDSQVRREITRVVLAARIDGPTLHHLALDENLALASRQQALALDSPWVAGNMAGDFRRATELFLESLEDRLARGELVRAGVDLFALALLRVALGEMDAAEEHIEHAARLAPRMDEASTLHLNQLAAYAARAFTRGDGVEALLPAGESVLQRAAPDQAYGRAGVRAYLAAGYALSGRAEEAVFHVRQALEAIERAPGWSGGYVLMIHMAVQALWLIGSREATGLLERNLREKVLTPDFRAAGADARLSLARLCASQDRFDEAVSWLAEARVVLEEQGARPLRALADHDEALMYARRGEAGDRERAAPLLDRAIAQFQAIGMPGWERRARALLGAG